MPGTWTDAYSYTWKLKKSGAGQVTGTVSYHGLEECGYQMWPVAGVFQRKNFSVTATNPENGGVCSSFFTYTMTIQ